MYALSPLLVPQKHDFSIVVSDGQPIGGATGIPTVFVVSDSWSLSLVIAEVDCKLLMSMIFRNRTLILFHPNNNHVRQGVVSCGWHTVLTARNGKTYLTVSFLLLALPVSNGMWAKTCETRSSY
jgi:hypothetical protein